MKNSASELFLLPGKQEGEMAYQLTFGYVRMLAILLRKGVKEGSKVRFGRRVCFRSAGLTLLTLAGRLQVGVQLAIRPRR